YDRYVQYRHHPPFPTRRSSDLERSVQFGNEIYYDMGVIIEKPEFFNELTGLENLEMLAKLKNIISREEMIDSLNKVGLDPYNPRSEEHTSELQSRFDLVCRLLL